jgi:hypothetical protein
MPAFVSHLPSNLLRFPNSVVDGVSPDASTATVTLSGPIGVEGSVTVTVTAVLPLFSSGGANSITCPNEAEMQVIAQQYLSLLKGQPGITAATIMDAITCTPIVSRVVRH